MLYCAVIPANVYLDLMIPTDLVPLPTAPYNARPESLPLDVEECRTAIWVAKGNISEAAEILKVPSARLRQFVKRSPYLTAEVNESLEQLLDRAESQMYDAVTDEEDKTRADNAAKFIIGQLGHRRGYGGKSGGITLAKGVAGESVTITWDDGTVVDETPVIEGSVVEHE